MHIYKFICTYVYMWLCTCISTTSICAYVYNAYIGLYMLTCIYVYRFKYEDICTYVYIYMYMSTCTKYTSISTHAYSVFINVHMYMHVCVCMMLIYMHACSRKPRG